MDEFLHNAGWGGATRNPIAGDASARRYVRLTNPDAILMIDPDGDTSQFENVANILTRMGLSAPMIHAHDPTQGLMIIEDLGSVDFAAQLRHTPDVELRLYGAAADVLTRLHDWNGSEALPEMTHEIAATMVDVACDIYAGRPDQTAVLCAAVARAFDDHVHPERHLALRDFHAENLIWRADRVGVARVGLLDFQDAVMAPIGYDLMSLLRDARRDVSPQTIAKITEHFCASIGANNTNLATHLACVSAQRNLRILGVFARLAQTRGKPQYLTLLPRVWDNMMADLRHPALNDLRTAVLDLLPAPDAATTARLGVA